MLATLSEIRNRLARAVDDNGSVRDMDTAVEAISVLEKTPVTKEALEETRLGLHVNNIRRATRNSPLAKRAKNLIKSWQQMIEKKETPFRVQRTRPETPNSLGSSPSPPEPPRDCIVHSHSSPQLSARIPRSNTPTFDGKGKRNKKRKPLHDGTKLSKKSDVNDGLMTHRLQSSEVRLQQQSLDTGQSTILNGYTMSSKPVAAVKPIINPNPPSSSDRSSSLSMKTQNSKLSVPHKSPKSKKTLKIPHNAPSPVPNAITRQGDIYNNNNTKMKSSKSAPNVTVSKPSSDKPFQNEGSISTSSLSAKTQSTVLSGGNLKRKHNFISSPSSPDLTFDRPRKAKERRLTYDPVTKELKVPSHGEDTSHQAPKLSSQPTLQRNKHTLTKMSSLRANHSAVDTLKNPVQSKTNANIFSSKSSKNYSILDKKDDSDSNQDLPSKICPSVNILGSSPGHDNFEKCDDACSSSTDFHKIYREFKKRKTRRKESAFMDMTSLYPLSRLVENLDSDSDGNSSPKSGFSSAIVTETNVGHNPIHSQYCKLPGVTGCRGNNGSWFDWSQMFCVNHHKESETLPEEKEIVPLQILPYVELD